MRFFAALVRCLLSRFIGQQPNAAAYRRHRLAAIDKECLR